LEKSQNLGRRRFDLAAMNAPDKISDQAVTASAKFGHAALCCFSIRPQNMESSVGVKKTGKGRRKLGRKKRRMRARIRHRKG
jgi:hypothetical protein